MPLSMARYVTSAMLVVVGVIHLLPLSGVTGGNRIGALYGIAVSDPNLEILMRHRAVLFGLLGAYLIYAAFRPAAQPLAFAGGLISVLSFLWLAHAVGSYSTPIGRIVSADILALACLVIGAVAHLMQARSG